MPKVFSGQKLEQMIASKDISKAEFVRMLIKRAPENLKPSPQQLNEAISRCVTSSNYLALYADVLSCSIDDFFEIKESGGPIG